MLHEVGCFGQTFVSFCPYTIYMTQSTMTLHLQFMGWMMSYTNSRVIRGKYRRRSKIVLTVTLIMILWTVSPLFTLYQNNWSWWVARTVQPFNRTQYTVNCTLYNMQCTIYDVIYAMYNSRCTLCTYTMYNLRCILYNVQFKMYIIQCTIYDVRFTM